jgi:diketogulonate reductase-like aldo/keto reductase
MEDDEAFRSVSVALDLGYRLIDTATKYWNESGVGRAIAQADMPRAEVFVSTKLRGADHGYDRTRFGFEESLDRLGLDYVDLYLIHWPLPRLGLYVDSWKALIELRDEGLIRSIGVSNFTPEHIERLVDETGVWPSVNQIELHLDFSQTTTREWHDAHGIRTMAWRSLGTGPSRLSDPPISEIAKKHHKTPEQVALRWSIQHGNIVIPKSSNKTRMATNLDIFDFTLSASEMRELDSLDCGNRLGGDPDHWEVL